MKHNLLIVISLSLISIVGLFSLSNAGLLIYSTYLGGSGGEVSYAIAVDNAGNAYITGLTTSSDFPTITGTFDTTYNGGYSDVFVTKLNASGTALVYSTYLGGSNYDFGLAIAIDNAGNDYITGFTWSTDFPTTLNAFDTIYSGGSDGDAFVSKLNAAGTALVYSTYLGGTNSEHGQGIAVNSTGNAYVTGWTKSTDFPTTLGAIDTIYNGGYTDVFVTKLNDSGTALVYSTYLGGYNEDRSNGIALDTSGNAYITGYTFSSDFPITSGAANTTLSSSWDAFISKIDNTGSALIYSTFYSSTSAIGDFSNAIAVDNAGNAYITGVSGWIMHPTWGRGAFVTKLNNSGSAFIYSYFFRENVYEEGSGIAVDNLGNAYVIGTTFYSGFPTTSDAYDTTYNGGIDIFLAIINPTGSALTYSTYFGGSSSDAGQGIAVDNSGNIYITGGTSSSDFPTTAGAFHSSLNGTQDVFVSRLNFLLPVELSRFQAIIEDRPEFK